MKKLTYILVSISLVLISWKSISTDDELPVFSPENLMQTLKDSGVYFPDIAWSQSALETGNWKSKVFKENHNLFGMKRARVRKTTSIGQKYGHATYNNWLNSVIDYKLWQKAYRIDSNTTRSQYITLLKRVYCPDKNYFSRVKKMLVKAKKIEAEIEKADEISIDKNSENYS